MIQKISRGMLARSAFVQLKSQHQQELVELEHLKIQQQKAEEHRLHVMAQQQQMNAYHAICKWFKALLPAIRVHKLIMGFKRLQAVNLSRQVRIKSSSVLTTMRNKLKIADAKARSQPALTLGKQTTSALQTLQSGKMISHLLQACQTLELSTSVSSRCASAFAECGASTILFSLIRSCNRSKPHQELLKHALVVVLHVARHESLAPKVAIAEHSTDVLVDLMQMFRDKKEIFGLACELLCRLIQASNEAKSICCGSDMRKRLTGLLAIVERKYRVEQKVKKVSKSTTSTSSGSPTKSKGSTSFLSNQEPINCIKHLMTLLESS
jgi:abnormal spindle-like microcephaly-associated protein